MEKVTHSNPEIIVGIGGENEGSIRGKK